MTRPEHTRPEHNCRPVVNSNPIRQRMSRYLCLAVVVLLGESTAADAAEAKTLQVATFQADVTPPLGSPLCNGGVKPAMEIVTPLTARGIVLLGVEQPIVLCVLDWVGIANESHDRFREALADAVGTEAERVNLHTLHQHDAPGSDFATERLLAEHGLGRRYSNPDFDAIVLQRVAAAAKAALGTARPVTHIGLGSGQVEKVASNRRILGPDGRVILQRQSSGGKNPAAREAPEGTIDPLVKLVTFWSDDQPCAVLTYYATHPQSYYGQGSVNWDFVGMARELREQALPGVPHIHFNGAAGNVAAGKYNDGSKGTRPILAQRLAMGMQQAWKSQTKHTVTAADVGWQAVPVVMPVRETLVEEQLMAKLVDPKKKDTDRLRAARDLIFLRRTVGGHRISISCLSLGRARILHMPGELFVEYQLAAQKMSPDNFVAMAAYGDYGPGYIGTSIAYTQGGYETGIVSRVSPAVEQVLTGAMKTLLQADPKEKRSEQQKRNEQQTEKPDEKETEKRSALFEVPEVHSSWDDLTEGIETKADWHQRRAELKKKYLALLRDQHKPSKPALDLKVHEEVVVDGLYRRQLISYAVEADERAHAYLGIPLELTDKAPAVVALHGTYEFGKKRVAGLIDNPDKAYLDHLCRRGYVVIAPEHFVSGHRVPAEGSYETGQFYKKHPQWTAVGKFTYEHSIAIDVLQTLDQVDDDRIGALGHSLGGHGTFFLAAYDERVKVSACNCGASFFRHNPNVTGWSRDHWYVYFKPIRPALLKGELPPIDFHEIIALIAPRAFMDLSGLNDGHGPTQRQRLLMLMKIMEVYEHVEAPENFAFYVHGRGHSVAHESRQLIYGWMDTHLKPSDATKTRLVTPESETAVPAPH